MNTAQMAIDQPPFEIKDLLHEDVYQLGESPPE
jgi:hypothetical protein